MKVVVAIDSLKGSLSSMEAGLAIKEGVLAAQPDAEVIVKPLADGGEGTTDALIEGMNGERIDLTVTGPMHTPVDAYYGYLRETNTAVMEMASAAGITLVPDKEKNPLLATSYGVGEMIIDAIQRGCRNFIIGIGGSITSSCRSSKTCEKIQRKSCRICRKCHKRSNCLQQRGNRCIFPYFTRCLHTCRCYGSC